jgi:hypothetical protein
MTVKEIEAGAGDCSGLLLLSDKIIYGKLVGGFNRQARRRINPRPASAMKSRASEEGSGTAAGAMISSVKFWFAPVPHVHS